MKKTTEPCETVRQLSTNEGGEWFLSVVAKRTYLLAPTGDCLLAEEQIPLALEPVPSPLDPNLLDQDLDLIPLKPRTDVVLRGHAYAGSARPGIEVSLRVGRHEKQVIVTGNRRCTLSSAGRILVSAPEPFEVMPIGFAQAYGGRDRGAEALHGNPFAVFDKYLQGTGIDASNQSPYVYPRNPCGKGYLIEATRAAVEVCEMPNLEDPLDLLTPDRMVVGDPERWIYMPIPQGFGWVNWGWFPRAAFGGLRQEYASAPLPIPEVERGWLPRKVLEIKKQTELPMEHVLRFGNGAPLDMQLPHLEGGETVELVHLHRDAPKLKFRLPDPPSKMCIDGREGKLVSTNPLLQTVLIEPDASRLTLVWRGTGPARRPYFPDELMKMPLLVEW